MPNNKGTRRKNGEGYWGTKIINGIEYKYYVQKYDFMDSNKYFYGKTDKEIIQKRKVFEDLHVFIDKKNIPKETFGDYALWWLQNEKKSILKPKTYDGYEGYINNYIKKFELGNIQMVSLNDINPFQKHINELAKKFSRATVVRTYSVIKQVLDYAVKNNHVSKNYAKEIKIPKENNFKQKKKLIQVLSLDDMEKLYIEKDRIKVADDGVSGIAMGKRVYGEKNVYIVILIMYTGMRISECMGLKWGKIDFDNNILHVEQSIATVKNRSKKQESDNNYTFIEESTKSDNSIRNIPLCDRAIEALKKLEDLNPNHSDNDYVIFPDKVTNIQRNITRTLNAMQNRVGLNKCGLHALRHSFGTVLIAEGYDIKLVSELLGHSDVRFTYNTYIHVIQEYKMKSVKIFDNITKKPNFSDSLNNDNLKILEDNNFILSEIEDGILAYFKDNKIYKLKYTDVIDVDGVSLKARDIYNEFYSK